MDDGRRAAGQGAHAGRPLTGPRDRRGRERHDAGSAELRVRLQPRARRTELAGERAGALLVRVTAPPVDGKAKAALCALLAERAGVAPSRVSVVRGASARDKVVRFDGVGLAAVRVALGLPPTP